MMTFDPLYMGSGYMPFLSDFASKRVRGEKATHELYDSDWTFFTQYDPIEVFQITLSHPYI